jgi:hypothetical protein
MSTVEQLSAAATSPHAARQPDSTAHNVRGRTIYHIVYQPTSHSIGCYLTHTNQPIPFGGTVMSTTLIKTVAATALALPVLLVAAPAASAASIPTDVPHTVASSVSPAGSVLLCFPMGSVIWCI